MSEGLRAGMIGLGLMGAPMSKNILKAGIPLTCYDLDAERLAEAQDHGASSADSPAALAAASDVVLVIVPSDDDVKQVCLGEQGVLAGAAPETVVVICSSVMPETCQEVAEAAAQKGVAVLDSPLTGGIRRAISGELLLLTGGDAQAVEKARPVLESVSAKVLPLGDVGSGQVGKTVHNVIHWGEVVVITEALALAAKLGLDVSVLRSTLMESAVDSASLRELHQMKFTWYDKDMANAADMAETVDAPFETGRHVHEQMKSINVDRVARLLDDKGWD